MQKYIKINYASYAKNKNFYVPIAKYLIILYTFAYSGLAYA